MSNEDKGFWKTLDLMVGREWRKTTKEAMDDVQDWVNNVVMKREASVRSEAVTPKDKASSSSGYGTYKEKKAEDFFRKLDLPKVECKFSHPHVRSRLEKLMGSNLVPLTDRTYMQRLQFRILEEYGESIQKRIKARETAEMERIKDLVLTGKIPLDQAPPEMANHPIMLIENYCKKLIAERRAKIKVPTVNIPTYLYYDDTPDPPSELSIEKGHVFRKHGDRLCVPVDRFLDVTDEEDIEAGYMFTDEEYQQLKYESPLIKLLKECQTVEEMYALADEIIGVLSVLGTELKVPDDSSMAVRGEDVDK